MRSAGRTVSQVYWGKSLAAFPKFTASGEAPHTLTHTVRGRLKRSVNCIRRPRRPCGRRPICATILSPPYHPQDVFARLNVTIALRILAMSKEALGHDEAQIVFRACHRDVGQPPLLLYLGGGSGGRTIVSTVWPNGNIETGI
jgi:hypothetical protein